MYAIQMTVDGDAVDQMRAKEGYEDEGGSEGVLSRGFEDVGDDWDGKEKGGRRRVAG
jgi:hypothetical protein